MSNDDYEQDFVEWEVYNSCEKKNCAELGKREKKKCVCICL